jgi:hypothetical protein
MKKVNIEKKELKRIINDLKKTSVILDGFGCLLWDMLSENEEKRYGEAEVLLITCLRRLMKVKKHKKKTI